MHQPQPVPLVRILAPRHAILGVKNVFTIFTLIVLLSLRQHYQQLRINGNEPVGILRLQCAFHRKVGSAVVDVPLDVNLRLIKIDVAPLQAQGFAAPDPEVIEHSQEEAVFILPDRLHDAGNFFLRQCPALPALSLLGPHQ